VGEDCLREMEVVDEDYLMKVEVVAEGCLLEDRCITFARSRSSSLREIFLSSWTTLFIVDSRLLSLPSKVSIIVDRFGCSSSFLAIVGAFVETLIPLDADREGKKTSDAD